ncbi:hypothetical protein M5K25_002366 [Dendrobium thyrsiflorum]|uniref:DNA/RNA-binding protein Alba-like domain-containing protein n=1 Tax=Dendrobium thyrsiflorum TaxID=117978 RepID=A0ABD0VT79_DENTH
MDRYQRVEKPRPESAISENEIRITSQGMIRNYISYATSLFQDKRAREIVLKAMGQAISKAVAVVEIIKKRIPGLHQDTSISSSSITDVWEPIEEGLVPLETTRHVSMITITLSTRDLNVNSPGYQVASNVGHARQQPRQQPRQQQMGQPYHQPRQAQNPYNDGTSDLFSVSLLYRREFKNCFYFYMKITRMVEDKVEVEEEEGVLEEVDMMGIVATETIKMRTGIGAKVVGVEEVGITMVRLVAFVDCPRSYLQKTPRANNVWFESSRPRTDLGVFRRETRRRPALTGWVRLGIRGLRSGKLNRSDLSAGGAQGNLEGVQEGPGQQKKSTSPKDLRHWDQSLKSDERHFVTHVLAFFVATDKIVIENLANQICTEVGSLDLKLTDGTVLIRGVAQTMRAVGKKMSFLVARESIVNIKGEATEKLEALYLRDTGSHHQPSLLAMMRRHFSSKRRPVPDTYLTQNEQAMKEAEACEATVAEAMAVPGEGRVAVEEGIWSSKRSCRYALALSNACLIFIKRRIQGFSVHKIALVLSQGFV